MIARAEQDHVSLSEAVLAYVRDGVHARAVNDQPVIQKAPGAALIGLMSSPEDAELMDEVLEMAMETRKNRWEHLANP